MQSGFGVDELLHFFIVSVNSTLKKGGHSDKGLDGISSSKIDISILS